MEEFRGFFGDDTRADLADTDGDTLPDGWEKLYSLSPTNPAQAVGVDIYFSGNNISSSDTDLSIFRSGEIVIVKGSANNDGVYTLDPEIHQERHRLTVLQTLTTEAAGLEISIGRDTDEDGLTDVEEYHLKDREPYKSDSTYEPVTLFENRLVSSWSNPVSGNDIQFTVTQDQFDQVAYQIRTRDTDLDNFSDEMYLSVSGSQYNDGYYTIVSVDSSGTILTVEEELVAEAEGPEITLDVNARELAFEGLFSYPDLDDTDGDGATDGEEVNGLFGGSNPTDPDATISALTGKFIYEGIEEGTYYLLLTAYPDNDTLVQTDISFDSTTNVIRSASGSFPDLTNWSAISILGSGDNDGIYEIDFSQAPTAFEIKLLESVQFEAAGASIRVAVAGQNDLSFESASRTIRTSTGHFGGAAFTEFQKWDTFSIFGSQENDGVYTVVSVATNAITVKESLTDEPAGTTVFFRRDPQRLQVPGSGINGDAYVVRGIPTHLRYTISGFLDVNGNGELDRLIDPQAHFLDGATMPGRNFNDLSIDLPLQDPDGSNIRILAVEQDPSGPLARKIIWKSIPGKTYRVRYSHESPAGPYNNYVLGTGGLPKEIHGYAGEEQTALIHYAASVNTYYRVEVKTGDAVQVDGGDISFVSNTRAIISSSSSFPRFLPGQLIVVSGSASNDGSFIVSRDVEEATPLLAITAVE
jgi:hypothetical protein